MTNCSKFAFVLFTSSATQRVAVRVDGDDVLVTKEWRKNVQDDWIMGKGISFFREDLIELADILDCDDEDELDRLLFDYEMIQEDNTNDNRDWSQK